MGWAGLLEVRSGGSVFVYSGVCVGDRTARDSGGLTVPTFMGNKRMNLAPRLLKQAGSFGIS